MSITSVAHACIRTTDLAATLRFYVEGLGMTKAFNFVREGKIVGFYLKAENTTYVEVFEVDSLSPVTGTPCLGHFCLQTEKIAQLHQRLLDLGYAPGNLHTARDHTPQFWIQDPNGLDVEFQEYTANSCQLTGEDCILP